MRQPPNSKEAEKAVLGTIILDNSLLYPMAEIISPEDFYLIPNGIVFAAMLKLGDTGRPIDLVNLVDYLKKEGRLDKVGGPAYITGLADEVPATHFSESYAKIIKNKSILRAFIATSQQQTARALEDPPELDEFLANAEADIYKITSKTCKTDFQEFKGLANSAYTKLANIQMGGGKVDLSTGYVDLDSKINGLHLGDLVIIAGRPGMGKTALALNIARNLSGADIPVAFFSLEMTAEALATRQICAEAELNFKDIQQGYISKSDSSKILAATNRIINLPLYVDDTASISVQEIKGKVRRLKNRADLKLVVVDYLQLIKSNRSKDGNREQEIADISRNLKALAKELKVCVIALSQLNRAVEAQNRMPRLSDLRESGAIEQDADGVLFVHRKMDSSATDAEKADAKIIIAKQRNGPTGIISLYFHETYTLFKNAAKKSPQGTEFADKK